MFGINFLYGSFLPKTEWSTSLPLSITFQSRPEAKPIIKLSNDEKNDWDDDLFSSLQFVFKNRLPSLLFLFFFTYMYQSADL